LGDFVEGCARRSAAPTVLSCAARATLGSFLMKGYALYTARKGAY